MKSEKNIKSFILVIFALMFIFMQSSCVNNNNFLESNNQESISDNNKEPMLTNQITIKLENTILNAILYDNKTAKEFVKMLPLTVTTWHPAMNFARAFDLPYKINLYEDEPAGYEYELGNLAYWYDGPSVAIIYEASRSETVVPVVPFGKIIDDVSVFKNYNGKITIEAKNSNLLPIDVGNTTYRDFILDNVYHSKNNGDIHYHSYFPSEYNTNEKYALFISLPGYEGLYFQGVGANIRSENFVFEALKYNDKMIIIAPQLNDWGQTSANQTIALVEFMLENYAIDKNKVFINGYSGGGETLSLVLSAKPELFTAALHVASIWDGTLNALVKARTPIYFVIGENDEYYGSARISTTYNNLVSLYRNEGLTDEKISELVILDVKTSTYFNNSNQHGGIGKVANDAQIMSWLFKR